MKTDTGFFVNRFKKTYLFVGILILIILFSGVTFSLWTWISDERTNIVFSIDSNFRCEADGGGNITSSDVVLAPATCMSDTFAIKREVKVTPTLEGGIGVSLNLWLNVDKMGSGLYNSNNFMYALTTNSNSCTDGVVSSGNFKNKRAGSTVSLLDSIPYSRTTTDTYYLYIWLDEAETSTTTMKQEFSLSLGGTCEEIEKPPYTEELLNGADPVLDEGMVPILLSNDGVATVADTSNEWYNYGEKEWANMVLVNENATNGVSGSKSREYYLNNPGTTVIEDDILAYYVWIPRYKYKIWTKSNSSNGSEETIEIVFESSSKEKSTGTEIGEYRTHPAFTFGSEELDGIWVGKFETSGTASAPTVKPNLQSLRSQTVSTQFTTSLVFAGGTLTDGTVTFAGSDTYGLTTNTDSHMMKNNEWGAVAYLSHSEFGINREIYINNSNEYYTGRSGGNVGGSVNTLATQFPDSSTSSNQYNSYGYYTWTGQAISSSGTIGEITDSSLGTNASTTGNITGVYDMSGGAWEYTMGVLSDSDGKPRSGNGTSNNSGFNGLLNDNTEKTDGIAFPIAKYYDLYTTTNKLTACGGSICYGHALSETSSWYGDYAGFVSSSYPWIFRGGYYINGAYAGAFYSRYNDGQAFAYASWRSVLVAGDGA